MLAQIVIALENSGAEAARAAPAGVSARIGHADPGKGLALENGGNVMRLRPIGITPILEVTRTSWSIAVRINFNR
jgi:hypothetical protein